MYTACKKSHQQFKNVWKWSLLCAEQHEEMHGHKQVSLLKYVVFTNTKEMNIKYPLITLSNYNLFPFILNLA